MRPHGPALVAAFVLLACGGDDSETMTILSAAMEPTFEADDRVEVEPIEPDEVERGDVVVLDFSEVASDPIEEVIFRVVGLPGEEIGVEDGVLTVDGVPLDEPWLPDDAVTPPFFDSSPCGPTCVVGADEVFVLGDNRMNSAASGMYGPVPADLVTDRVRLDD